MGSGRRTPSAARTVRIDRSEAPVRGVEIAPLYKRLPHGPHRLARDEVMLNQRARIHGAMVEAVARSGYEETSVKQVIGLAGVSRRSFYEQFANKQECFLATFDVIVRRGFQQVRRAYLATDGTLEERARASFERFAQATAEDRNASTLAVLEAQTAGVDGALRLCRAIGICEQMLAQGFAQAPGAAALPVPIVRGIAGGLHGIACASLRHQPNGVRLDLVAEMLEWTMCFHAPTAERITARLTADLTLRIREIASIYGHGLNGAQAASHDERTRMLGAALRLATREAYHTLSAPQIADEANVSLEAFWEQFAGRDECYLAALDMVSDALLAIAADPELVSDAWPRAVRRVLAQLMRHLADHPLHTRTLVHEGFFAGADACERIAELAHSLATLLIEGAPAEASGRLTADAVAGAIWHTICCQVAAGRIPLLAALSDQLAYLVLAPHIGAGAAAELLLQERLPVSRGACETGVPHST